MGAKRVYLVHYVANGARLEVQADRKRVPMDEFGQTHTPIQVTSLTDLNPGGNTNAVGLLIAEEVTEKKASSAESVGEPRDPRA